jgi:hypothetical protein
LENQGELDEFKLGQWPPIFVEDDAMDRTGLLQDRVGDPGLLQEL